MGIDASENGRWALTCWCLNITFMPADHQHLVCTWLVLVIINVHNMFCCSTRRQKQEGVDRWKSKKRWKGWYLLCPIYSRRGKWVHITCYFMYRSQACTQLRLYAAIHKFARLSNAIWLNSRAFPFSVLGSKTSGTMYHVGLKLQWSAKRFDIHSASDSRMKELPSF